MIAFVKKLLGLCRPYRRRLALGVLMGLLGGLMEPLFLVCVKVAVDVAFPGANVVSAGSPVFSLESINNTPALAQRLKTHSDGVSEFLWNRFSSKSREIIESQTSNSVPRYLPETLVAELNLALTDPGLYDNQRFTNITLSADVKKLVTAPVWGGPKVNRMLLQSAYPEELSSMNISFLDQHPWLQERLARMERWLPSGTGSSRTTNIILVVLAIPVMMFLRGLVQYLNVYMLQWVAVRAIADVRTDHRPLTRW